MSDIHINLEHQTEKVIKELEAIRKHIFFKLEGAPQSDRAILLQYENKILSALDNLSPLNFL